MVQKKGSVNYNTDQTKPKPPYATSSTFIVVAPLFVGAGSYLLITRLCLRVLPPSPNRKIFHIPILKLTRIFVSFDVLTLLIQASGSAIAASNNWEGDTVKIGENVLIGGLALQLVTFSFFLVIVWRFHVLVGKEGVNAGAGEGWRKVLWAVYVSCSMIIVSNSLLSPASMFSSSIEDILTSLTSKDPLHLPFDRIRAGYIWIPIHTRMDVLCVRGHSDVTCHCNLLSLASRSVLWCWREKGWEGCGWG